MSDDEDDGIVLSPLQVTRAIHELLLIPSQQSEVQTFFASLFVALLFQISFLVTNESTESEDKLHETVRYPGSWASVLGTDLYASISVPPLAWPFPILHAYFIPYTSTQETFLGFLEKKLVKVATYIDAVSVLQ